MAWFELGHQPKRYMRKGIFLRPRCLPEDIMKQAKKMMRVTDSISHVIISELRPDDEVLLEFWCQNTIDFIRNKSRYNVFHLLVKEDLNWICESDIGRGLRVKE